MKKILMAMSLAAISASGFAQTLNSTSVADQFTTGSRSNQANLAAYSAPTYPEITGTINYSSTFGGGTASETEVKDVTTTNVDVDPATIPGVSGNTADTSSTSPNFAVFLGDGGGGQNLEFGSGTDSNYTITAAFYCDKRTLVPADVDPFQGWERTYVTIRNIRAPSVSGSNSDADGGYAINWESDHGKFQAVKWNPTRTTGALAVAAVRNRDATARTVFAETAPISSSGWHKVEIGAYGTTITFKVDGVLLTSVTDSFYTAGIATLCYREAFTDGTNEHQGRFDYFYSKPTPAPPVPLAASDWSMYQ